MLTSKLIAGPQWSQFVDHSGNSIIELDIWSAQDVTLYTSQAIAVRFAASEDDINFALDTLMPLRGETNYRFSVNTDTKWMGVSAIGGSGFIIFSWGMAAPT